MAIDFDELNNFLRKSPMILSQADVLDWSETMTNDVKTKQDSAMFYDWQRSLDKPSRKVLNLSPEPEDESEKEF